jgi:glyoxylase-like metal-dependent hydrolase (beta-lactamase superfamily II)
VSTLTVEVPRALSPLVRRVVADNPGLMTGPGTNTYLVGVDEVAVIDPGPALAPHIDAVAGAAGIDRVRWILLTHTHPDHWPAAEELHRRTGAPVCALPGAPRADAVTVPIGRVLADGEAIEGSEFRLEALHTPGHAPNHCCFLLAGERGLFTGDHVLEGTTTVVNPQRGGDMAQYLASLERLRAIRRLSRILPGHGDVMTEPTVVLDAYLAHRRMREREIVTLLAEEPRSVRRLTRAIYPDVAPGLAEMARRQVYAHLRKLRAEGRAAGRGYTGVWRLTPGQG